MTHLQLQQQTPPANEGRSFKQSRQQSTSTTDASHGPSSKLVAIAMLFVVANAVVSGYRVRGDPWNLGFVLFAYGTFVALLFCIGLLEKRRAAAEGADGLKVAIWALATVLNATFAWRVTDMLPLALAAAAWFLVLIFSVISFYALILYRSSADSLFNGEEDQKDGTSSKKKLSSEEQV